MSNVIQSLIHDVLGDGARSTKFDCLIGLDTFGPGSKIISALAKSASFPGKSHEIIDLKYKGRTIPIRGQTKYENTWSCTFYLDEMHTLKKAFEDAIEALDEVHNFGEISNKIYQAQNNNNTRYTNTLTVVQLDFDGTQQTVIYNLYNVFPKSVSQVQVDYSEVGKVQEFTVEFSYSHFDSENIKSADGSFVDTLKAKFMGALSGLIQKGKDAAIGMLSSVIGSARDIFNSNTSGISGSISDAIDSGIASLEQIDFNPSNMIE